MGARLGFLACLLSGLFAVRARAEEPATALPSREHAWLVTMGGRDDAPGWGWNEAARWLEQRNVQGRPVALEADADQEHVARERLEVLKDAERALTVAREHAARLEEREAFEVLARAEQSVLGNLDIPGAHAWLSELWIALATVAAQRGEPGLAHTWLARAASIDPERHVGAAEAPPSLVALSEAAVRARDGAPRGRFRVAIEPEDATVSIDGEPVDLTREWATAPGVHVLRASAPGYRPYAALIDVLPGTRAPLRVVLAAAPGTTARRVLAGPLHDAQAAEQAASSLSAETHLPVWLFEGAKERVLAVRCQASGCTAMAALERDEAGKLRQASRSSPTRAWLTEPPLAAPVANREPSGRVWPWLAASGALIAAGLVTTLATREPGTQRERELIVDPGPRR